MNQAGYTSIAECLKKELYSLKSDLYKIAVVGEYKTGKSTLINRIFLKDNILFTDIMEATAIPTEINYGTEKILEVIPFDKEKEPVIIKNPCPEDIKLYTSAQTPDGRAFLSENTGRVKLSWPANNLDGLTIFDTPGINSINSAVITATYRIIPEVDLVLFVTGNKQLSNVELEFLSTGIFSQGITRAVAVVTLDHDIDPEIDDIKQMERLTQTIKSQLSNIGCENIPVETVNIRDNSDLLESGNFRHEIEDDTLLFSKNKKKNVNDVISSLLGENQPNPVSVSADLKENSGSFAALEKKLISFIRDNVRPGRIEKASKVLNMQIQLALVRCETELSVMTGDEIQRQQMLSNIKIRESQILLKHEKLSGEFKQELLKVEQEFIISAQKGLEQIAELYIAGFETCDDLNELQQQLKDAQFFLKRKIEEMFITCFGQAEKNIQELVENYGIKSRTMLKPWYSEISRELNIDGGILAKIPQFAFLTLDIMLFVRFGPFGPLADILIRLLANYIPILNKALPISLAASVLKKKIKNSLETEFETIKKELPDIIKLNFDALINNIIDEWYSYTDQQISTIRKSIEKISKQPVDKKRQAFLKEMVYKLKATAPCI